MIIACILSVFLCAGCVSARKYQIKCAEAEKYKLLSAEAEKYKLLSEDLSNRLDKVATEKNRLEVNNKILTNALTEASTPSKLTLEEAIQIWKKAIGKLETP